MRKKDKKQMKNMKNMMLAFFIVPLLISCADNDPEPPVEQTKVFEKIWSTRIYEAPLENVGSDNAYIYKDWYIVTGDHWSHHDPSLYAYDTKTGKLAWKWKQNGKYQQPGLILSGKDNILILSDTKGILGFDIETQQILWEHLHGESIRYLGAVGELPIYGNHVYKILNFDNYYGPECLVRYHILTGKEEKLSTFQLSENQMSPNLSPPALWLHPETNDSILVMVNQIQRADLPPEKSPTDIIAFNMTTKKIEWKLEGFTPWGTNGSYAPVVFENTIMVAGDWSIYAIDLFTGRIQWRTQFPNLPRVGNFTTTKHLLIENRLYVNPAARDVMCLDADSGSIVWHNKNAASNCSLNMLYHKNKLIIGSKGLGSVVIMDALSGHVIHTEQGDRNFYTDVLYDKTTDMYFVQDFAQAVGFKIK